MANPAFATDTFFSTEQEQYLNKITWFFKPTILNLKKTLKNYLFFCSAFTFLIIAEIIYLAVHLTFLMQNFALAIHLGLIFATIFSFLILRFYMLTLKKDQIYNLQKNFITDCEEVLHALSDEPEYHILIAKACCRLATQLHDLEYEMYALPGWLKNLQSSIAKVSCFFHWQDVHLMKEILLKGCVGQYIKLVRKHPTDLEAHVGLANGYVMLSGIYVDPRNYETISEDKWIPSQKYGEVFKEKFQKNAKKAIEEFKIINNYAPNDPWVHVQLAYSYRDLKMPEDEIKEYELILQLSPNDKETMFKLGKIYFEQGLNAKGLQVYETLKSLNYKKAESLIHFYGGNHIS